MLTVVTPTRLEPVAAEPQEREFRADEVVLGKLPGYPAWPSVVVDPSSIPEHVLQNRPKGERYQYCVCFIPKGDYGWPETVTKLSKTQIEAYVATGKSGGLASSYQAALRATEWLAERRTKEAQQAATVPATPNLPSHSKTDYPVASRLVATLPSSCLGFLSKTSLLTSAPRILASSSHASGHLVSSRRPAPSVTFVQEASSDSMIPETISSDVFSKGCDLLSSPDRGHDSPEKGSSCSSLKKDSSKGVKQWRRAIQRTFQLGVGKEAESSIDEKEMPQMNGIFKLVEAHHFTTSEHMEFRMLKVMKHIQARPDGVIPCDDTFRFRERAKALVHKWTEELKNNDTMPKSSLATARGLAGDAIQPSSPTSLGKRPAALLVPEQKGMPSDVVTAKRPRLDMNGVSTSPLPSPPPSATELSLYMETVLVNVAGEMFKVPRDIFANSSLSTPLANIPMDSPAGMVVDDVSKEHFSAFCRVRLVNLYNLGMPVLDVAGWTAMLEISVKWKMDTLRADAIAGLERVLTEADAARRVSLGRLFNVQRWITTGASALVQRAEPLNFSEIIWLGALSPAILALREKAALLRAADGSPAAWADILQQVERAVGGAGAS